MSGKRYFGRQLPWHFAQDYAALEISLYPDLDNSHAGYGFLEIGADLSEGKPQSFGINFDVVAHEDRSSHDLLAAQRA